MINDFYLHLMDWSSLNHMAVALSAGVFIWNATDGTILQLCQREVEEEYVASVSWIKVTTFCSVCVFFVKKLGKECLNCCGSASF
jgi:hypothetical protein